MQRETDTYLKARLYAIKTLTVLSNSTAFLDNYIYVYNKIPQKRIGIFILSRNIV